MFSQTVHNYIKQENLVALSYLIPNYYSAQTLLNEAAKLNKSNVMFYILRTFNNLNTDTVLKYAIENENVEVIRTLIDDDSFCVKESIEELLKDCPKSYRLDYVRLLIQGI